ncbi:MAG TPA: YdcF family protein [Pseudolabrys sp.]|nr:YdcF family protein [Pseudolabrys sp.]
MLAGLARWIGFLTMTAFVVGVLALSGGYYVFASNISTEEIKLDGNADGIVVLTGAATRIPDAMELLAAGRGKRLLITGVHHSTSAREIARLTPLYARLFACCVDLDRSALNTFGNAIEAKRWAKEHHFASLIVVTSNWHMPRAMAELEHQGPALKLIPFPVVSDNIKSNPWWSNAATARLVLSEYLKYLFAIVRMHLDPDTAT